MSFREKSAWISLISISFVSLLYLPHIPWTLTPGASRAGFHGLIYCVLALVVIEVVAHLTIALRAPRDGGIRPDERDQMIALKALRIGAYVYALGSMLAVVTIHLGANQFALGYLVVLALAIAEIVNYSARVVYYRRGV
jgi:hypothetical protein